jgi:Fe2+ transport system protein FeoA
MIGQSGLSGDASALSTLPAGQHAIIDSLQGEHGFRSRVANLGFTTGATVTVVQNYGHGPMLVALRGTLVALGRAEAAHVLVRAGEPDPP